MKLPETNGISESALQEMLEYADSLNLDLLIARKNYRGHNGVVVVLCGPDTEAYLQALERTRDLLAEDADLIEESSTPGH